MLIVIDLNQYLLISSLSLILYTLLINSLTKEILKYYKLYHFCSTLDYKAFSLIIYINHLHIFLYIFFYNIDIDLKY